MARAIKPPLEALETNAASARAPSTGLLHVAMLLSRVTLGWYVMLAGLEKVQEEISEGLGTFFRSGSFQNRSVFLPEVMASGFGYMWPWLELVFGLLLLLGLFGRITAGLTAALLGCIGVSLLVTGELLPRHHVMVFVPLALLLLVLGPDRYSLDRVLGRS